MIKLSPKSVLSVQVFAAVFALIGLVLSLVLIWLPAQLNSRLVAPSVREETRVLERKVLQIERELEDRDARIDALYFELTKNPNPKMVKESKVSVDLKNVESSVENLTGRFTKIESLIVQDPSKALEIPLLRKDMEATKESSQMSITALRQDLERTYSLLVGTMVALALAVFAPLISNIFRKKAPSES